MKKELDKWQFVFIWGDYFVSCHRRHFVFGIFKLTSIPEEGTMITKQNYKGFLINKIYESKEIKIEF